MSRDPRMPLVYSCSGCSSAAQMTNALALRLDREGVGEMSCIAGVGGNVRKLVRTASSGRPIVALDGCPLACARSCLAQRGLAPDLHRVLTREGVRKRYHADYDPAEAERVYADVRAAVEALGDDGDEPGTGAAPRASTRSAHGKGLAPPKTPKSNGPG